MSEATPIDREAHEGVREAPTDARTSAGDVGDWHVRRASAGDAPGVAAAVRELLFELGGRPAPAQALQEAARTLAEDENAGVLLLAEAEGRIVGLIGVSWQYAVRIPGRYGLIQELWVHPGWRSQRIGEALLGALGALAREEGVGRIEVGLPSERFPNVEATRAFYERGGFTAIGLRMRLLLE